MFEKVNPSHPDKVADRIAGAVVDLAYAKENDPKVAVEVLIGHDNCNIIIESSCSFDDEEIKRIVNRIVGDIKCNIVCVKQDEYLAENQKEKKRCGDNGIFKGMPTSDEQRKLSKIAHDIYKRYPSDGKYILSENRLIICQSKAKNVDLKKLYPNAQINPLGEWNGGINVDSGATNRKLGSDMGDALTGGGLHGKDLSKADVSLNIYAHLKAQELNKPVMLCCAIGDEMIDGKPYSEIVDIAKEYIESVGGFEEFAKWGLI